MPALKRTIKGEAFPGALKRSFPRMNAGAPTEEEPAMLGTQPSRAGLASGAPVVLGERLGGAGQDAHRPVRFAQGEKVAATKSFAPMAHDQSRSEECPPAR